MEDGDQYHIFDRSNFTYRVMTRKQYTLVAAIILLVVAFSGRCSAQTFYEQLNQYRVSKNLKPLRVDTTLEEESAHTITSHKGLVHGSSKNIIGEVLAKNCDLDCWLESKSHKKILLSRKATRIGFVKIGNIACARLSD